jgi:hypothetical protein
MPLVIVIYGGGGQYWDTYNGADADTAGVVDQLGRPRLLHRKYLGDGELLLFEYSSEITDDDIIDILNGFYILQSNYDLVNARISEKVPLKFLPPHLRVGIAFGSLLELTNSDTKDKFGPSSVYPSLGSV